MLKSYNIAFEHLSLSIQKQLGQSMAVCGKEDHGRPRQSQVQPGECLGHNLGHVWACLRPKSELILLFWTIIRSEAVSTISPAYIMPNRTNERIYNFCDDTLALNSLLCSAHLHRVLCSVWTLIVVRLIGERGEGPPQTNQIT